MSERRSAHRYAIAKAEAGEAFLRVLQGEGFKVLFPDQTAVPSEWLIRLFQLVDPEGVGDLTAARRPIAETQAANIFNRLRDHVASLQSEET